MNAGSVTLETNGGNILFKKLNAESSVILNVKNGDISGTIVDSYDDYSVAYSIKKGESNIPAEKEDGAKKLTVSINNGDVDVNFVGKKQIWYKLHTSTIAIDPKNAIKNIGNTDPVPPIFFCAYPPIVCNDCKTSVSLPDSRGFPFKIILTRRAFCVYTPE